MRCTCCNKAFNDFESTAKELSGDYLDTCMKCLKGLGIPYLGNPDYNPYDEAPDGEDLEFNDDIDEEYEDE